jgi:hypothetical protein
MDIKYNGKTSELLSYKFSIARDPYNEWIIVATIVSDHDRRGTSFVYDDRFPVRNEREGAPTMKECAEMVATGFACGPYTYGEPKWGFDKVAKFLAVTLERNWTPLAKAYASDFSEHWYDPADAADSWEDIFTEAKMIAREDNPDRSDYDRFCLRHSMAV